MLNIALADVIDMLDKLIKAIDEELWEEGLMSIGDTALPQIGSLHYSVKERSVR